MDPQEKQVTYTTTNTYGTLNKLTENTKNVWVVLHGIGYLSRYFLKYFDELPADENYIIAPQAPAKYYLNNAYRHVGASWLTKEHTILETQNVLAYLDTVWANEDIPPHCRIIVFGFSQGVSIATRWVASRRLKCERLVLYAGGIPNELKSGDFDFMEQNGTQVTVMVGDKDEYITSDRLKEQTKKMTLLFGNKAERIIFNGGHVINKSLLNQLLP